MVTTLGGTSIRTAQNDRNAKKKKWQYMYWERYLDSCGLKKNVCEPHFRPLSKPLSLSYKHTHTVSMLVSPITHAAHNIFAAL